MSELETRKSYVHTSFSFSSDSPRLSVSELEHKRCRRSSSARMREGVSTCVGVYPFLLESKPRILRRMKIKEYVGLVLIFSAFYWLVNGMEETILPTQYEKVLKKLIHSHVSQVQTYEISSMLSGMPVLKRNISPTQKNTTTRQETASDACERTMHSIHTLKTGCGALLP